MNIVSHDWMEQGWYPASFAIAGRTFHGRYFPSNYKLDGDSYIYSGIFESEQAAAVPERTGNP
jgi:hypothetical protein